jgi:hypothetical protein
MTPEEERRRSIFAREIIENPLWNETITLIRNRLMEMWQHSDWEQTKERENVYQLYNAVNLIQSEIETTLKTGKMAEMQLEDRQWLRSN